MSDRHEWTDDGLTFAVKPSGIYPGQPMCADPMTLHRRVAREILRLAARVKELEGLIAEFVVVERLKETQGLAARVKELEERVEELDGAAAEYEVLQGRIDSGEYILGEYVENAMAVVEPVLPLFRERFEAWERIQGRGITGSPEFPKTVTLTAEFPVEALRALTKE